MTTLLQLDVDFCRAQFPALRDDLALFDNAGGSVTAEDVIAAVTNYMRTKMVQLGASYALSQDAQAGVDAGRRSIERLLGADEGEVALGSSSTVLVKHLARAVGATLQRGDEIVVTNLDHETNVGAWRELEQAGATIREWRFDPATHALELADLEPLLSERTRVVAFTHCANVVGGIHDVPAICERVREAGAWSVVDGVAFAPHRRVDVKALGADFYFASAYKVYGPHIAALYGRTELLRQVKNQNHVFVGENDVPYKLEPGNAVHELAAGLAGIERYLQRVAEHHSAAPQDALGTTFELFADHEERTIAPLVQFLVEHPRTTLLGPQSADRSERVATIAFTVEGLSSPAVVAALDPQGLALRHGDFYAWRAIRDLGLSEQGGIVRASAVHYTSAAEVERLIAALDRLLG